MTRRPHTLGLSLLTCTLLATASCMEEKLAMRVVVNAGGTDRHATPVSVELDLSSRLRSTEVVCGGASAPAQIERAPGHTRVWWIVDDLPAGESREYVLEASSKAPGDAQAVFHWQDTSGPDGKSMDLLLGGRPVLRYMYTPFDPNDVENTKKPFHHIFDPDGSRLITKGVGGLYPHHRGIFFGYHECKVDGKVFDTWHGPKGEHQVHREVLREIAGPVVGGHVVHIDWNDREGKPFAEETRELLAFRRPGGELLIEFRSHLTTPRGEVVLTGDRQHAGAQFRAAQDVAENQPATRYLRPAKWADLPADKEINTPEHRGLPWNALQYPLGERRYTVACLSDPANPDDAEFSERLYGRFGEFFPWTLTPQTPLTVRYRWWIAADRDVTRDDIERVYQDLADPPRVTRGE